MELLGWLTSLIFAPPGPGLMKDLGSGALEEALGEVAGREVQLPRPSLSDLQAAHTALFVTNPRGVPAPPYTALARDGILLGPSFYELLELYTQAGLLVQDTRELPDHLAILGEALALTAQAKPELAGKLAREYLLPWLQAYGPRVEAEDPTGFYAQAVRVLREALEEV